MPQALIGFITPYVSGFLATIGASTAFVVAASGAIAAGIVYGGLALAAYAAQAAFTPQSPQAPKPEDGKFNLKQSVPPLVYVLGPNKKAGDYAFLEEKGGTAHHIMVWAAHHIKGFNQHYLHDQKVTINSSGVVTSPGSFGQKVRIYTRLGNSASTAYAHIVSAFPSIWTNNHRGDGLATVAMAVQSVAAEDIQKRFPQGMPQHSVEGEGHDRLYDPRTETEGYSESLAVFRFWHLTHPVGGKLAREDMYLPDWMHAADVGDQTVTNRSGGSEPRYHGGLWFRANNDPRQVGRLMDQAADLVIYERADGKVGVHAGEFVTPDIRLTADDIISVTFDANKRKATNVIAVRGRYTDPSKGYNTADAAIYGIPYPSEDERTKTVDNQAVQRHNHVSRLQKLAYIRANAPQIKVVAHFEAARQVPYRRFVRVHVPPMLDEAVVELIGRPALSLQNMTYTFDGLVVPASLYAFNAATEEGAPGANVEPVLPEPIPVPDEMVVTIDQEEVAGGATVAFAVAIFDDRGEAMQYELEWQPTSGGAEQRTLGSAGATEVRSAYLADGVQYRFRARTWSVSEPSEWTDYQIVTATADPVPPGAVTGVSGSDGVGQVTLTWTAPNSSNYVGARIYLSTTNDFGDAQLAGVEYGAPSSNDSRTINGLAPATYYGWVMAINGSGVGASPVAAGAMIVT